MFEVLVAVDGVAGEVPFVSLGGLFGSRSEGLVGGGDVMVLAVGGDAGGVGRPAVPVGSVGGGVVGRSC